MNQPLKPAAVSLMLAGFAASILLHVDRTPLWCVAVALAAVLWYWLHQRRNLPLPPAGLRIVTTLALFAGIAASFRTVGGLAAGSALLVVMGAAKLMETRAPRDAGVVAAVSLVLVLAACLDRQSLPRVPLYLATGWIALGSLAALGGWRAGSSSRVAMATAGRSLLLALPFAVLCFALVPRLQGAMWSMPHDAQAGTGLAEEMSPGSISELSSSEAMAFRVRFDGNAPPESARYWRGPVLHDFDGTTWRRQQGPGAVAQASIPLSPPLRYHVLLEPTGRAFLFGIDSVAAIEGHRNFITFDGQVLARRPVTETITYDGISYLQTRTVEGLSTNGRRLDTRLPVGRNPRSIALGRDMRAAAASDDEYAQAVLAYFRNGGFEYTLTPPLLGAESVDDFLFNSRRGFCGHFASAYATLMRAGGVPARVVTGYLGATWNPVGGFYTVRQSQAHAWVEIWIDDEGWTRIDPTSVIAPERLQGGAVELLTRRNSAMRSLFGDAAWLRNLRDSWDAASSWWQERIVNFNRSAQLDLLRRLGLGNIDYQGMALLLAGGATLWGLVIFGLFMRSPRAPRSDALGRIWNNFIALLEARGMAIAAHDGPRAIAARAAARWPAAAADIIVLAQRYEQLRFGTVQGDAAALRLLQVSLRKIARATASSRRPRTAAAAPE